MSLYTYEVAKKHLDAWLACDLALATSQSYTISGRTLTRANLKDVQEQIRYWQKQVDDIQREQSGAGPRRRVRRYIPIDL
ncbi:DUF6148 family protein [Brevibacillus brevis]|uniref:DUF6148 family protein n=1 Tax=Brevibacillus brevis TaxID=1393 RepID=UPI001C8E4AA1|nr:DUF6148 family protein [Brevibacillus brevis]MBY0088108.1 hypothetical protein [Brevibacillus brevis]